jgi:uncharacterized protein YxeA
MKKSLKSLIAVLVLFVLASMFSCSPLFYDNNDSYYSVGSPYYHTQHYYVDFYYDHSSPNYHRQHYSGYSGHRGNGNNNHRR